MNPSTRLPRLRYALAAAYRRERLNSTTVTPGLHHLLSVPLRERLVLLAKLDGANPRTIRQTLPVTRDDAEGTSDAMLDAIATWRSTLDDAFWHLPERSNWRYQKEASVEKGVKRLLWADVAVALIGDAAIPQVVSTISLRKRLILYALLVDDARWIDVRELFKCTDWEIRRSIQLGLEAVGGT